jgi:anti-anti-sigma factor
MEEVPFGVEITRQERHLAVRIVGELDFANASKLEQALTREIAVTNTQMVLDFHRVTFLDSEGLKVIVSAYKTVTDSGGSVSIVGCSSIVGRLFDILGLRDTLGVETES